MLTSIAIPSAGSRPIRSTDMQRLGVIMSPQAGNADETGGVLNPGAMRHPDGALYLFPRLVADGNYSRIGVARALYNANCDPVGVERLVLALEPHADFELGEDGRGGCEDPRVSFVEPLGRYIMSYVAFGSHGPRAALAAPTDLRS